MIGVIKGTMRQKKEVNGLPLPIASYKTQLKAPIRSLKVAITAKQSGSGTPAPDNIRPIIGVSECNVVRCGKNLFNARESIEGSMYSVDSQGNITITATDGRGWQYLVKETFIKKGTYTLSRNTTGSFCDIRFKNENYATGHVMNTNVTSLSFTVTEDTFFKIKVDYSSGSYPIVDKLQLELGSTATAYEAYNGNTYTIQLGDTYYGGSLDVTNGVLTVTHEIIDLSDVTFNKYNYGASNTFYGAISTKKFGLGNFICDKYSTYTGGITNMPNYSVRGQANTNNIYMRNTDCETSAEIHEALNGTHLVYELATPITVQLTPTQVEQLLGANNVWADTGDVEELIYTDRQVYYGR